MNKQYDTVIYLDGKWWMVEIPELSIVTQARRKNEVIPMAKDAIATYLDLEDTSGINLALR